MFGHTGGKQTNADLFLNHHLYQFKHCPTKSSKMQSYFFSVGWDSPLAEGLVEAEGQCLGVFQSCDLQQTGDCVTAG